MAMLLDKNRHFGEDQIERYSMGAARKPDAAKFERHLLMCETCQQRLQEADSYVAAMRAACAKVVRKERKRESNASAAG